MRKALPQVLEERVFGPLGMKDTGFWVPPGSRERLASAYRLESGHLQLQEAAATSAWTSAPAFPDAAAGLDRRALDARHGRAGTGGLVQLQRASADRDDIGEEERSVIHDPSNRPTGKQKACNPSSMIGA